MVQQVIIDESLSIKAVGTCDGEGNVLGNGRSMLRLVRHWPSQGLDSLLKSALDSANASESSFVYLTRYRPTSILVFVVVSWRRGALLFVYVFRGCACLARFFLPLYFALI